jgi:hypothetical protein
MPINVKVQSQSPSIVKGAYRAEIEPDRVCLFHGSTLELEIPVGARAEYMQKNRFAVALDDGRVELALSKFGIYQQRLAKDLVSFLNGKRAAPTLSAYSLPWYFWVISALPIGIPILAMGGAIPGMLGFAFAAGCFTIAQNEEWPTGVRIVVSLALAVCAYVLFFGAAVAFVLWKAGG